jgi:3,4-dihydroxy-2-butanone 4-phosphate synthase
MSDDNTANTFNTIEEALTAIRQGEMVMVVDDDDRENEGDLIMAASKATPEAVAFMIRHTSGILCTPILQEQAVKLHLDPMVSRNDAPMSTAFTVSIDYKEGLTTGISAEERAATTQALTNSNVSAEDFVRPGHIFPLVARQGGVLVRSGHTEAGTDLAILAGLPPVGLLAELVNDDGTVQRLPELMAFSQEHNLKIITIADLIAYRQQREQLVQRSYEFAISTAVGDAQAYGYKTKFEDAEHIALVFGDIHAYGVSTGAYSSGKVGGGYFRCSRGRAPDQYVERRHAAYRGIGGWCADIPAHGICWGALGRLRVPKPRRRAPQSMAGGGCWGANSAGLRIEQDPPDCGTVRRLCGR